MDNLPNLDYAEEYGDDGTGRSIELQPTILPIECNLSAANIAEQNTVENVHLLFQFGIIHWPNFTNCLPNCGLCTQFASDQFYITYNLVVIGLLLPFISLCGLCGNVLSAFVYSRPSLRQSYSGSLYLSALGCSDALVIITALFLFFVDSIRRYSLALSVMYGSLSPVVYPTAMIAQTCSVYFTLVAGIDCFVQVWLSTASKNLLARQCFQKTTICAVLLFSLLYNIPHCFESILLNCWHQSFQSPSVELCPAPLRFNPTYTLVYYKYMYAFFLAVGPLVVLIALNTAVVIGTMCCKRGNSADNMALILVVLLFILCNSIALLINIFETHLSSVLSWRINYIIDISNLLVVFNSSFNFVIYYNFSRPFRAIFLRHFCQKKVPLELAVLATTPQAKGGHHRRGEGKNNGTHKVMVTTARREQQQQQRSPLIGLEKSTSVTLWASKNGNGQKWNETLLKEIEQNSIGRMEENVQRTRRKKMKKHWGKEEEEEEADREKEEKHRMKGKEEEEEEEEADEEKKEKHRMRGRGEEEEADREKEEADRKEEKHRMNNSRMMMMMKIEMEAEDKEERSRRVISSRTSSSSSVDQHNGQEEAIGEEKKEGRRHDG